jgi:large subunit ribosomal protein L23
MSKRVLIRPYVTEKTTQQMQEGTYSFVCGLDAQVVPGKRRRQFRDGNMIEGRTSGFKKAIVALDPEGEQINFFEGI